MQEWYKCNTTQNSQMITDKQNDSSNVVSVRNQNNVSIEMICENEGNESNIIDIEKENDVNYEMICDDRSNESNVKDIEKENDVIEIEEIDNDTDNEDNETIESGTEDSDNEDIEDMSEENIEKIIEETSEKKVVPLPEEKRELIINSRKMAKSLKTTDNVIHCYEEICQLAHDDTKLKMDYFTFIASDLLCGGRFTEFQCTIINILFKLILFIIIGVESVKICLSYRTIKEKGKLIDRVYQEELMKEKDSCKCYSVCIDETDDTKRSILGAYSRLDLDEDLFVQSKLACSSYYKSCNSKNITKWLKNLVKENNLDWAKFATITTDGASTMRGINNGVVTKIVKYIEKRKENMKDPIITDGVHCFAHKTNLCTQYLCKCECIGFVFGTVNWLSSKNIYKKYYSFSKENNVPAFPKPSNIRWGYKYDCITYIIKNYKSVCDFIEKPANIKSLKSYLRKMKIKWINKRYGFEIRDDRFVALLSAIQDILFENRKFLDSLQIHESFLPNAYKAYKAHIEKMMLSLKTFDELVNKTMDDDNDNNNDNDTSSKDDDSNDNNKDNSSKDKDDDDMFKEYFIYCEKMNESKKNNTNSIVYTILRDYVNQLIYRFASLRGEECLDLENIEKKAIKKFSDFEKFEVEMNEDCQLFQLLTLIVNFEKGNQKIPDNLNAQFKQEYEEFLNDLRSIGHQMKGDLLDELKEHNPEKHNYLIKNINAVYVTFPTSCPVESLFSIWKNMVKANMSETTMSIRLNSTLQLNAKDLVKFSRKEIKKKKAQIAESKYTLYFCK